MDHDPQKTVLVVEDDGLIREALAELLELEDYKVHTAANGREALDWLLAHRPPRLIVTDLMMPVMDGWELLEHLREHEHLADVPVVVTTANTDAPPEPALEVLEKPYELDELLDAVRHCEEAGAAQPH